MHGSTGSRREVLRQLSNVHQFLSQLPITDDPVLLGDSGALCFALISSSSFSRQVILTTEWQLMHLENAVLLVRSVIKLCKVHNFINNCTPILLHTSYSLTVGSGREREYTFSCFEILLTSDWSLFLLPSSSSSPSIVFLFPSLSSHASLLSFIIYLACS